MPKHDHTECTHIIKLCTHCDVVFCGLCSKEWGQQVELYPPSGSIIPYTATTNNPAPDFSLWHGDHVPQA